MDVTLLKSYETKTERKDEERLPRKCVRCTTLCSHDQELCHNFGMAVTLEAALKRDEDLAASKKMIADLQRQSVLQTRIVLALLRKNGGCLEVDLSKEDKEALDLLFVPLRVP